jgi:hypothetical protein
MSEAVEIQAPAADAVSAVKGMKKNGKYTPSGLCDDFAS